jgi:DNA-binding transcriptional LysR family regulator
MLHTDIHRYLKHGTLTQLRAFEASARLGSLTRAAQELHMAQPTASLQIKKLAETVGLPLFEQIGKRIYLTDAGQHVYAGCREVFAALGAIEQTLTCMRKLDSGHLRLAVSSSGKSFAPRLLGAFLGHHPGVETSMRVHNHQGLLLRLANNEDDLYVFAALPEVADVVTQELLPNPLVVLARDDHPLAGVRNIALERLAQENFLVREEGSCARRIMMKLFARHGLTPKIRMELDTNEAIKEAILAGLGVSIMSRYTFGLDPESSRYVCLDVAGFPLENHWYFAYPVGKQLSAVARAFLDFARAEARGLVLGGGAVSSAAPARVRATGTAPWSRPSPEAGRRRSPDHADR